MTREIYKILVAESISPSVIAFLRGESLPGNHMSSDGTALIRIGQVIAWWVDDDIYMMVGPAKGAVTWLDQLHMALGRAEDTIAHGTVPSTYYYNGKPIGPDEVIKLEMP